MQSIYRLKKNYQYNYVYKHAKHCADGNFTLLYCANHGKVSKVGFSVSKKQGKAVERNRIRRQMKAAASNLIQRVKCGYNVVFIPKKQGGYLFGDILNSFEQLLTKAGLLQ